MHRSCLGCSTRPNQWEEARGVAVGRSAVPFGIGGGVAPEVGVDGPRFFFASRSVRAIGAPARSASQQNGCQLPPTDRRRAENRRLHWRGGRCARCSRAGLGWRLLSSSAVRAELGRGLDRFCRELGRSLGLWDDLDRHLGCRFKGAVRSRRVPHEADGITLDCVGCRRRRRNLNGHDRRR